jgi:uncharacterized membrane protein YhaH (DUF805 family)
MKCTGCGSDNPENAQFCGGCGVSLSASTPTAVGIDAAELPMVDFGTAVKLGFQRYVDFSDRSTRAEYWWWGLFTVVASFALFIADTLTGNSSTLSGLGGLLDMLFTLATIIPSLALGARRLHDINRTGWWLLLLFVPVIGWIVLIVWAIERGDKGTNKYGPDPRQT